jgi:pSer/pThr/pTyr-binding forkhead associated (FHA) protein
MPEDRTRIIASFSGAGFPDTHGLPPIDFQPDDSTDNIPANAFLVLDGTKIIPLNHPVLNIGRRLNNQVVINDKRISRTHAQLRVTKGRFAIFDLNSTGGTFVNGQRINKTILYPGDMISLAGVTLIYGQDLPSGQETKRVIAVK